MKNVRRRFGDGAAYNLSLFASTAVVSLSGCLLCLGRLVLLPVIVGLSDLHPNLQSGLKFYRILFVTD